MKPLRVALLYPGDAAQRERADLAESRFAALFEALAAAGLQAEAAVWHEEAADAVRAQLLQVDGVLVWCNPIEGGRRRDRLDALLQQVANAGVRVSSHPDTVQRLGTKDVLLATRGLPFGSETLRIGSLAQLRDELPARLQQGPRVLKQRRGHSGIGVWKVALAAEPGRFMLQHAQRGAEALCCDLDGLVAQLTPYFAPEAGACLIDQPWQPGIRDGMLRAYLVRDRVAGFGHQAHIALHPEGLPPGPRLYHGPEWPPGQALRERLETGWLAALAQSVGVASERLPLLWDADFIPGPQPRDWVLCEVNVSSVSPYPPSAVAPLVAATQAWLREPG